MHLARTAALVAALTVTATFAASIADFDRAVAEARERWAQSPHGPMLERVLPPTFAPAQLPEAQSRGAETLIRYCVQCHNLPNPAMHHAQKWPGIVERMVLRMEGRGNMGELMKSMMDGVQAPTPDEATALLAYLQKHSQQPIDAARYPDLDQPSGQSFKLACSQCHVLPDPRRHTAQEWTAVVARMEQNMAWMNRIVGNVPDRREPQLRVDEILSFLQKHARKG